MQHHTSGWHQRPVRSWLTDKNKYTYYFAGLVFSLFFTLCFLLCQILQAGIIYSNEDERRFSSGCMQVFNFYMPVLVCNIQKDPSKCKLCEKCLMVNFSLPTPLFLNWGNFLTAGSIFIGKTLLHFWAWSSQYVCWVFMKIKNFKNVSDLNCSGLIHCFKNSWISSFLTRVLWDCALFGWVTSSMAFYEDKNTLWSHDHHGFFLFVGSILIDCHINLCAVKFVLLLDSGNFIL